MLQCYYHYVGLYVLFEPKAKISNGAIWNRISVAKALEISNPAHEGSSDKRKSCILNCLEEQTFVVRGNIWLTFVKLMIFGPQCWDLLASLWCYYVCINPTVECHKRPVKVQTFRETSGPLSSYLETSKPTCCMVWNQYFNLGVNE